MIGAKLDSIKKAEDRDLFKEAMRRSRPGSAAQRLCAQHARRHADPETARFSGDHPRFAHARRQRRQLRLQPGGIQRSRAGGLSISPVHEVLIEESVLGWKEFELEVMRDHKDNVVIICSIENFDPMGVHTGDSITVAPAQTLTDKEYQIMRDAALRVIREIGVDTGGSNIQFAVNPKDGRMVVIEMNPRVSRSSALASKATGFPIAKIAAKLAIGYTLDEIPNDITRETPACFEPTIDYVVVKIPRFTFEKFPQAKDLLTPQMKSVGEAMAIGRTFKESLQKAMRSLEIGSFGFEPKLTFGRRSDRRLEIIREKLRESQCARALVLRRRLSPRHEHRGDLSTFQHRSLVSGKNSRDHCDRRRKLPSIGGKDREIGTELLRIVEADGLRRCAASPSSSERTEGEIRGTAQRKSGVEAVFNSVDTCGAEFHAFTPYLYSTYEGEDEVEADRAQKDHDSRRRPEPYRAGIEFDYCCVHAAFALKEEGYETIMVNCNPETVSTDYDTSDKLYFEPLDDGRGMNIVDREKPDGSSFNSAARHR